MKTRGNGNQGIETSLEGLLLAGLLSAKKAGDAIMEVYHSAFAVEMKEDRSPLTLADKRSHEIIAREMGKAQVNGLTLPVLSEEGRSIPYEERKNWEPFWLIDPLDGTKEFVKRNGEFTVNIALVSRNRPVLGIIYAPVRDIFYFAARGMGSFRRGEGMSGTGQSWESVVADSTRLRSGSTGRQPSEITVAGSRSHGGKEMDEFLEKLRQQYEKVNFLSAGSSLKFCIVAEGGADLYVRHGPTMEWDTAAGQIIVEEAGGAVVNLASGQPLEYNKENLLNPAFLVQRAGLQAMRDLLR